MSAIKAIKVVKQSNPVNTASVLFFHGSGDTGNGIYDWVKFLIGDFKMPHVKFIFPTAPLQPYTPSNGEKSYVWFDRKNITPFVREETKSIELISKEVKKLIESEVNSGIPLNRIVVGGFSMGGSLSLYTAFKYIPGLAGVFALSSFLNKESIVYDSLQNNKELASVPIFMCHGDMDTLVHYSWGKETFDKLESLGVKGEFHEIKNCMHEIKEREIKMLFNWISNILPE